MFAQSFWSVTFFPVVLKMVSNIKKCLRSCKEAKCSCIMKTLYNTGAGREMGSKAQVRGRRAEKSGAICTGRKKL